MIFYHGLGLKRAKLDLLEFDRFLKNIAVCPLGIAKLKHILSRYYWSIRC